MKSQRRTFFSSALSAFRLLLMGVVVVTVIFALNQFRLSQYFPITKVKVYGGSHLDRQHTRDILLPLVNRGFFAVKVDSIRERLLQMPWVADTFVRRNWPDRVDITVVEKKPVALWNKTALLSDKGEIFTPQKDSYPGDLPSMFGPEDKQFLMLQTFKDMNRLLLPLHVKISYLELTPYFTWKMTLDNGITLQIGHKDIFERLDEFVKVYPKIIGNRVADVDYIDLRYPNGVAVRWKESA